MDTKRKFNRRLKQMYADRISTRLCPYFNQASSASICVHPWFTSFFSHSRPFVSIRA
jgi:hypothetical protein